MDFSSLQRRRGTGGGGFVFSKNQTKFFRCDNEKHRFILGPLCSSIFPPYPRFSVSCPFHGKELNDKCRAGICRLHLTTKDAPPALKGAVQDKVRSKGKGAGSSTSEEADPDDAGQLLGKKEFIIRDWLALRLLQTLKNKLPDIFEKTCPRCGTVSQPCEPEVGSGCRAATCPACGAGFCHLCDHAANFAPQRDVYTVDPCHAHVQKHLGNDVFCEQDVAAPMQRVATLRRLRAFFSLLRDGRIEEGAVVPSTASTDDFWDPAASTGFVTLLGKWREDLQTIREDFSDTRIVDADEVASKVLDQADADFLKRFITAKMGEWLDTTDLSQTEKETVLGTTRPPTSDAQTLLNDLENGKSYQNATGTNIELCSRADVRDIVLSRLFPRAKNKDVGNLHDQLPLRQEEEGEEEVGPWQAAKKQVLYRVESTSSLVWRCPECFPQVM